MSYNGTYFARGSRKLFKKIGVDSFHFVFQLVCPAYFLQLPEIKALPTDFKRFWSNNLSLSDMEQVGISPTYEVTYHARWAPAGRR